MPRSLQIQAFKKTNEKYSCVLSIEPYWWYQAQLIKRYKFTKEEETHGYIDYILVLTKELLEKINNEELNNISKYNTEGWQELKAQIDEKIKELQDNFESYSLVRVAIYEYDSWD